MLGSVIGDIIGSRWEGQSRHPETKHFLLFNEKCSFTDDTVLSCAVADVIMNGGSYRDKIREYYRRYPHAGYGSAFKKWGNSDTMPAYNSYGNGSAMRVSPIAFAVTGHDELMAEAEASAEVSHNHPEGIKGAQAITVATGMAWKGSSKKEIKDAIENMGYRTDICLTSEHLGFDCTCQETVPQAIYAFLHSDDFETTIRDAVMMGGDSDTIAAMAGGIAQAYYKDIPKNLIEESFKRLPDDLAEIISEFTSTYVDKDFSCSLRMNEEEKQKEALRSLFS